MDEHESLTGQEAEGIRIIGAVEAGPTPTAGATPTRKTGSAPQSSGSSPWESGDDADEWDDSWLAGDGDLELDPRVANPSRNISPTGQFDDDADHRNDPNDRNDHDDHDDDDDDATGEHPNLWASGTSQTYVPPQEAVRVLGERGGDMEHTGGYDKAASDFEDNAGNDSDDSDDSDDENDDYPNEYDDYDDRTEFRREFRGEPDNDFDDESPYADSEERLGRAASASRPTLLIADADDDLEPVGVNPATKSRRRSGRAGSGEGESSRRSSGASREPRRRSGAGPVEPAVAAGGNRVVTGLALVVVAALVIRFGKERGVVVLAMLAGVAALLELFTALRQRGFLPAIIHGLVATAMFPVAAYLRGTTGVVVVFILSVLVFCLWYLVGPARDRPVVNIAVSMLGLLYIGFMVSIVGLIVRGNPGTGADGKRGVALFVGALIGAAVHDIAGLFVGKNLGRVPIAPEVSPNKTLEGLVGGIVCAMVAAAVFGMLVEPFKGNTASIVLFALIIGALAPLGDLVESMMKRDLGIKDMGSILPGHGGVLDRIDAMLFVMPGVYLLALAKGWVG